MFNKSILFNNKPLIWPIPNKCKWEEGYFLLESNISLSYDSCFEQEISLMLPMLKKEGVNIHIVQADAALQLRRCSDDRINDEGYILEITETSIIAAANTNKGIFYCLHSLLQLISNSSGGKIPSVSIIDSPFKPIRGVHIYIPPRDGIEWFKRYVDFLAKYKYNTMFMEVGAGMKYDKHPEINKSWEKFCQEMIAYPGGPDGGGHNSLTSMQRSIGPIKDSVHIEVAGGSYLEKSEIANILKYIKDRHIEVYPEVQSLSHCYWLLLSHPECAERDDDPFPDTYCPSNPETYELYFECLQEVIDLFKPKMVHIGHDELYTIGLCEKCKSRTGHDIFADDVIKIHDYLAERGIKTILWSDKLIDFKSSEGLDLAGRERLNFNRKTKKNELMKGTYRAIDKIPNDVMVMDWYYNLFGKDTGSQDYFNQRGIKSIFGNYNGYEFPNFTDRIRRPNVLGGSCSLWSEVSDIGMAIRNQYPSYLNVANQLWYEGNRIKMQPDYDNIIARLYPMERDRINNSISFLADNKGLKYIDISSFYNATLNAIHDYSFIVSTEKMPGTIPFEIIKGVNNYTTDPACVILGNGFNDSLEKIDISSRFRSIAFLHSYTEVFKTSYQCVYVGLENNYVGYYIINYSDGSQDKIPIEYGRTITSINSIFTANRSNPVYLNIKSEDVTQDNIISKTISIRTKAYVVYSFEWKNPFPEKEVKSITIEHDKTKNGGIVLFGITGVC